MRKVDILLLIAVVFLTVFGLFMIYDASSYVAFRDFSDKYRYIKDQIVWAILGFGALGFASLFDYKKYYNLALPILLTTIALLILVLIPGIGVHLLGARRWINLHFTLLQPAEFVKLGLAIYLSAWFSSSREKGNFIPFLLLLGFIIFLVMLEPDMGTAAIILFEGLGIYFLSGANIFYLFSLVPIVLLGGIALIKLEPYRAKRLATFLDPSNGLQGSSYHVRQILIALGSGGLTGVGIGNSLQKYAYLPESTTDSIFAIVAEEFGFIGSSIIILIFALIVSRGFYIALNTRDNFGRLLAGGITIFLAVQVIINLGAQTALLPLTGIPLPFISYGGSALIVDLFSVGILLNISRQSKK